MLEVLNLLITRNRESIPMRTIILTLMLTTSIAALDAAEKTVVGTVNAVDSDRGSITVNDVALDLTRKSQISIDGRRANLSDIRTGQTARVTYDDALEVAISVIVGEAAEDGEAWIRDLQAIQGVWKCVAGEENGRLQDRSKVQQEGRRLIIKRNSLTMDKAGSSQKWVGKFEVDATTGDFDWIGKTRLNDGWQLTEWTGIYELKGDELKLCFIFDRDELAKRPTEFESLPPAQLGLAHAFYTFKRVED